MQNDTFSQTPSHPGVDPVSARRRVKPALRPELYAHTRIHTTTHPERFLGGRRDAAVPKHTRAPPAPPRKTRSECVAATRRVCVMSITDQAAIVCPTPGRDGAYTIVSIPRAHPAAAPHRDAHLRAPAIDTRAKTLAARRSEEPGATCELRCLAKSDAMTNVSAVHARLTLSPALSQHASTACRANPTQ